MTITAAVIDAALAAGNSPRMVAKAFKIPVSMVMNRERMTAKEIERRREEAELRRIERERREAARAASAAEMDRLARRDDYQRWVDMPITYEDHPASRPFDYSRAFANTVALSRNPEADRTLGGVVQYGNGEAA
jgi:hypothetical protein